MLAKLDQTLLQASWANHLPYAYVIPRCQYSVASESKSVTICTSGRRTNRTDKTTDHGAEYTMMDCDLIPENVPLMTWLSGVSQCAAQIACQARSKAVTDRWELELQSEDNRNTNRED